MKQFITIQEAIAKGEGDAHLRGWVYRERESNKFKFIVLRDGTNVIQCVVKKDGIPEQMWNDAVKLKHHALRHAQEG
jgi:aspartyl/asparaginyl-tRNA synthetase